MTALSADRQVERYEGEIIALTVKAGTTIYKGSLVNVDATGYAVPAADAASVVFMGVAMEGGTAGQTIRVYRRGIFKFAIPATATIADVGQRVYVADSATVTKTASNGVYVGRIIQVDSATSVWVDLEYGAPATVPVADRSILTIPVKLANLANGDIVTTFTPGFAGTIEKISFVVTDPATTADKAATLNLEIGTTDVTGGVLSLTTTACGTLGKVTDATAITGNNAFEDDDAISVEATNVTAFAEGEGALLIVLGHTVEAVA
jgi:predicted RecA/RadA family phage recombinase